jgi:hypothetical protein
MTPNSFNGSTPPTRIYRKRKHHQNQGSDNDFSDDESNPKSSPSLDDDRREHHNELERRRRDHIKDQFTALKNTVPLLEGEKSSRALILKRAIDYITLLQVQLKESKMEAEEVRRQNDILRSLAGVNIPLKPQSSIPVQIQMRQNMAFPMQAFSENSSLFRPQPTYTSNLSTSPTTYISTSPICQATPTSSNSQNLPQQQNHNVQWAINRSKLGETNVPTTKVDATQLAQSVSGLTLSSVFLQNQLLNLSQTQSSSNKTQLNGLDSQTRLLADSLALRERQLAAAAVANLTV